MLSISIFSSAVKSDDTVQELEQKNVKQILRNLDSHLIIRPHIQLK